MHHAPYATKNNRARKNKYASKSRVEGKVDPWEAQHAASKEYEKKKRSVSAKKMGQLTEDELAEAEAADARAKGEWGERSSP